MDKVGDGTRRNYWILEMDWMYKILGISRSSSSLKGVECQNDIENDHFSSDVGEDLRHLFVIQVYASTLTRWVNAVYLAECFVNLDCVMMCNACNAYCRKDTRVYKLANYCMIWIELDWYGIIATVVLKGLLQLFWVRSWRRDHHLQSRSPTVVICSHTVIIITVYVIIAGSSLFHGDPVILYSRLTCTSPLANSLAQELDASSALCSGTRQQGLESVGSFIRTLNSYEPSCKF